MKDSIERERIEYVFISYADPDRQWAEWCAWTLRDAGYQVELDAWNWAIGENFISHMNAALSRADAVLALWSKKYFETERFTADEWMGLIAKGEIGRNPQSARLIPIWISEPDGVHVPPTLRALISDSLAHADEVEARKVLIRAISGPLVPISPPRYPAPSISGNEALIRRPALPEGFNRQVSGSGAIKSDPKLITPARRNLAWEKLSAHVFENFIFSLLSKLQFSNREWRTSADQRMRTIIATKNYQDLPGRTSMEQWLVVPHHRSGMLSAGDLQEAALLAKSLNDIATILIITTSEIETTARAWLTSNSNRRPRVQCIEKEYLEELAAVDVDLVDEYLSGMSHSNSPESPAVRSQYFAELKDAWESSASGPERLRHMQDVFRVYEQRYGTLESMDFQIVYITQRHYVDYLPEGIARRTYQLELANISNRPIHRDTATFYGEIPLGSNESLQLSVRSLADDVAPPTAIIAADTYNVKVFSLDLPHPIKPLQTYGYEIAANWPYPAPLLL
jgi:TIR domain